MIAYKLGALALASLTFVSTLALSDAGPSNSDIFCSRLLQQNSSFSPTDYTNDFDPVFIKQVPFAELQSIFSGLYADAGSCVSFSSTPEATQGHYILTLNTDKGFDVSLLIAVSPTTNLFSGLLLRGINNPAVVIHSWEDMGSALKGLDVNGTLGATLKSQTIELT